MAKEKIGGTQHIASFVRAKDANGNWLKCWNHNADLRADSMGRYSPYVLFHGDKRESTAVPVVPGADEVEMAPPDPPQVIGEESDAHHGHEVALPKLRLRMQLLDEDGKPRSGLTYTLSFSGKPVEKVVKAGAVENAPAELKLDDDGMLDAVIPDDKISEANALLRVKLAPPPVEEGDPPPPEEWLEWVLTVGRLNPIKGKAPDEWCVAGVQQRLNNLGFGAGPIDGICGRWTRCALSRFQKKHAITEDQGEITRFQGAMNIDKDNDPYPDAIPGTKTRAALEKLHDTEAKLLTDKPKPPPRPTSPKPKRPTVAPSTDESAPSTGGEEEGNTRPPEETVSPELAEARRKVEEAEAKHERTKERLQTANQEKSRAQFVGSPSELEVARQEVNKASREHDKAYRELMSARSKLRKLEGGS